MDGIREQILDGPRAGCDAAEATVGADPARLTRRPRAPPGLFPKRAAYSHTFSAIFLPAPGPLPMSV